MAAFKPGVHKVSKILEGTSTF